MQSNQVETYYSDYFCDDVPKRYSVNWGVSGGTILAQTELYVTVRWNANVSNGIVNMSVTGSCASAFQSCCASLAINIQPTTVVISGNVTNNCGGGVSGVTISFGGIGSSPSYSTSTDNNGFYSVTVPYGWNGNINASKPSHSFSPSQSSINTTADRTLNFSVVAQAGFFISISECNNQQYSIGGLIPGFEYIITYENPDYQGSTEVQAHSPTQGFDFNRTCYKKICVQPKCGSQVPVCRTF